VDTLSAEQLHRVDQPLADAGASGEQGWRACSSPAP